MRLLTTDLFEGAYLMSCGMELRDIWTDTGDYKRSVIFEFGGDDIELLKDEYRKGNASANVLEFKRSLNELKDRMFAILRDKRPCFGLRAAQGRLNEENKGDRDEIPRERIAGIKG
jgi:hypothetical protein